MDWLSKADPNVVISWVSVAFGGLLWLYHKARGDKTASAEDILTSLVTQVINQADVDEDNIKARVEVASRAALLRIGIKGATADLLVHRFVEDAAAQLHERYDAWTKAMNAMDAAAKATIQDLGKVPDLIGADGKVVPRENWAAKPGELGNEAAGEITGP